MTNSLRLTTLIMAMSLMTAAQAQAEPWHLTGSIVYNDGDVDRTVDDGVSGLQLAAGWDFNDWLTLEGRFTYSDIDGYYRDPPGPYFRASEPQLDLGAHVLVFYDRQAVFAPYAMLGVGYQNANLNFGGKENNPTASVGAGFNWKLGQSRYSLRTEVSSRWTMDGNSRTFNDSAVTLGVQYAFGKSGNKRRVYDAEDVTKDTDRDGVPDMWDDCLDTPIGAAVTARGCEIQEIDRDSDSDRVPDSRDKCPNTPTGMAVDADGCSLDSDQDGVPTAIDRCPASLRGESVDEFGCSDDTDKDGVRNAQDRCLNTRFGVEVDRHGCEIRDVISLPGVNFQSGSDLLLAGAENLIRDIAATLKANDYLQIEVAGHTDSQGSEISNQGLSDRRAKTVYDYLVMYGVDEDRLSFRGYGESQPIADNATADGRATNRRVELRVIRQ
jgi:OOP family OmpA-OmpF porin